MTRSEAFLLGSRWVVCKGMTWQGGMLAMGEHEHTYDATYRLSVMMPGDDEDPDDGLRKYMGVNFVGAFPSWGWPKPGSDWVPDLRDAATRGCLLDETRKAWNDPYGYVAPGTTRWWPLFITRVPTGDGYATEVEALVASRELAAAARASMP